MDREAPQPTDDEEYFELLTTGEAVEFLCARDDLAESDLSPEQRRELAQLDDLLVKHYRLIEGNVLAPPGITRSRWWWFLNEGPQVREQASIEIT